MKKLFSIITIAAVMTACTSSPPSVVDNKKVLLTADTVGLAQFQVWKAQNELKNPNEYGLSGAASAVIPRTTSSTSRKTSVNRSVNYGTESAHPAKTAPKGWSKAAKGTAIGAGTGAVLGAVINKRNRVVGGVIGAVLGGGIGYGIGRSKDKKDGRY